MNLSFLLFVVATAFSIVIITAVSTPVSAQFAPTQGPNPYCGEFYVGNHLVDPRSWTTLVNYNFSYTSTRTHHTTQMRVNMSLCMNVESYTVPPTWMDSHPLPGCVLFYDVSADSYSSFDWAGGRSDSDGTLVLEYFSFLTMSYLDVVITCGRNATTLRPKSDVMSGVPFLTATNYTINLEIDQLCADPLTSAAPSTTPAPTATSVSCQNIQLDGKTIDPNTDWGQPVDGYLDVPQLPGTSVFVLGDLCTINQAFTVSPNHQGGNSTTPIPGYWLISPNDDTFPNSFDIRELDEINQAAHFIKYKYSSTATKNELFVYISCNTDANGPPLTFRTNDITYFNNTKGGRTFTINLKSPSVCPAPTTRPAAKCNTFVDENGQTKNPFAWPPAQGILKNIMSGEAATVLLDVCDMHHFTSAPSFSFAPGYLVLLPFQHDDWPQTSFDLLETAQYESGFFNQYVLIYRSSQVNRSEDRATVRVQCGGNSNALTFGDRFILPVHNPSGGLSYEITAVTQMMCNHAAPPTTTMQQPPPKLSFEKNN